MLHRASYNPAIFPRLIGEVEGQGYATLITDSWSHFWMGEHVAQDSLSVFIYGRFASDRAHSCRDTGGFFN
ncbi:MAG TPA: hypothetical protein VKB88_45575 [Bryobacteraceae bacterium]|nr:hypothetical protein [Bryobacteraceae bacterium]